MMVGRAVYAQGDLERAESILRGAVRALQGIDDRGSLCEAQRALAMTLAEAGRIDEAERVALEARETVGPEERVTLGTTALARAIVRAKQGRDDEAEPLFVDAVESFHLYGLYALEHWGLRHLAEFLRSRGRDDDARRYEERRDELAPSSTAPMV
jgi:tetratricopeptide (TPR) repeat protein